jgi:hypothetical protein
MSPPLLPPIPLFPAPSAINLVPNAKLQDALDKAVTALTGADTPPPFGLTIVDLTSASDSGKNFASAGWNQDTEYYAASMLKVACLYAAHGLRDLVQRFALARKPKNPDALFELLKAELNPQIAVCCPRAKGGAPKVQLPDWRDVFAAHGTAAALSVRFTPSYTTSLEKMIVPSNNAHAGRCIRGVGYAYLNGLMLKHGFFDESDSKKPKGVWLAGDYSGSDVVTIPCDNDVDTKQGTTSAMMARLGTVILMGTVIPGSHGEMIELLKKSAHGSDSSYFTRTEMQADRLNGHQVTHGKIGLGPLKSKRDVFADLNAIADPVGGGGRFVVCYTNVDYNPYSINDVLRTFLQAVRTYQSVAAPAAAPAAPTPTVAPRATVTH